MIYAIGDIHGKFDLLKRLYSAILKDIDASGDADNTIVFLGDYIDRGRQNRQVLDFLKYLEDFDGVEHIFLRGNHEDIFKEAMEKPRVEWARRMWTQNGGQAFLNEVGMDFDYFVNTFAWQPYVNWMKYKLEDYYETEDYVFVHGGLDIRKTNMKDQEGESMRWARHTDKDWYRTFHKLVVHGHTPNADVQVDINRINVDTSWSYSKYPGIVNLTAVALPNRRNDEVSPPRFLKVEDHIEALVQYCKDTKSQFA